MKTPITVSMTEPYPRLDKIGGGTHLGMWNSVLTHMHIFLTFKET
jgi:hypothetical protein